MNALKCLLCGSTQTERLAADGDALLGATSKGVSLYPFNLIACRTCGHVQKELNESWWQSIKDLYETYEFVGVHINRVNGKIVSRDNLVANKLNEVLDLAQTGSLLDFGCGKGTFLRAFGQEKPHWARSGYDLSELYKKQVTDQGARFYFNEEVYSLSETFDLITFNHVLEHLIDPARVVSAMARLLKPGGHLVARVPSFEAVHTDFFLMDHCSHFTRRTLGELLERSGLEVTHDLKDLSEIEIALVAGGVHKATGHSLYDRSSRDEDVDATALRCMSWARALPDFIKTQTGQTDLGIFGVGGAGLWLAAMLPEEIRFFVDEDPIKQGKTFSGRPIYALDDVPTGSSVVVTFNNPKAAARLCKRLQQQRGDVRFIAPPAELAFSPGTERTAAPLRSPVP